MRKLLLTFAAAALILAPEAAPRKAGAAVWIGGLKIQAASEADDKVEGAVCRGWGRWCGPGFVRACGHYRCWCRPCY